MSTPSFNRSEVEAHVSLLHDLAEGCNGVLILAGLEEGGPPSVQRFRIGDVAGMVETIMGFDGHPRLNLYSPWCVMRRDLDPGKKGAEADVIAVLAAVGDLDNDKYEVRSLPVEAPYIVESSPGNFQPVYVFEHPLPPLEAKPVLTAICDFVGGDTGTKDASHVWRIPGTVNIPTKSKLARGRSPIPAPVTIKKHYDGGFVSPAALLALAPAPRRPNGPDTAPSGPLSFAEEARLRDALRFIPADDRNNQWRPVCMALHTVGARALCDAWSKTSDKFDADEQEKIWASLNDDHEPRVTIATIYHMAREYGWRPSEPFFERTGERAPAPFVRKFKGGGAFIREYVPISYTLDRILPSGVLYFVTARRGHGKTAWLLAVLFAVGLGRREIIGADIEKGHVAFICLENPADVRMKMAVYAWRFNVDLDDLDACLTVIDARLSVPEIIRQLERASEEKGPLQLVGYDTFQAGFGTCASKGEDFNDNAPALNFTLELRKLLDLPGHPSVIVAAHPTKNAGEAELIPYGGGATANEYDGNFTLWAENGTIKFHWLDKLRGPEFTPRYYRIELISSPDILDTKGRQIELPVCVPLDDQSAEQRQTAKAATNVEILKAMRDLPHGTLRQWAAAAGVKNESTLRHKLAAMAKHSLIAKRDLDNKYQLTPKGRKELSEIDKMEPRQ